MLLRSLACGRPAAWCGAGARDGFEMGAGSGAGVGIVVERAPDKDSETGRHLRLGRHHRRHRKKACFLSTHPRAVDKQVARLDVPTNGGHVKCRFFAVFFLFLFALGGV